MPNLLFMRLRVQLTSLAMLAGCASAAAVPADPPSSASPSAAALPTTAPHVAANEVARLRALGPAALTPLFARWDAMPASAARDELARTIDAVAGQRYATISRMYWYTDLVSASAVAKALNKPILALRMLGRLDEDLSCANSRLFRSTLYANTEVSAFLRDNFVLFWSSERDVPRVTIDFGDGRRLEGTTTGNSAHYVLTADGTVIDVLPGLYAPKAFQAELTKTLALARKVAKLGPAQRSNAIEEYHRTAIDDTARTWQEVSKLVYIEDRGVLLGKNDVASALEQAQLATVSKSYIEVPALAQIAAGVDPGELAEETTSQWAAIGQYAWQIGDAFVAEAPADKKQSRELALAISMGQTWRIRRSRGSRMWRLINFFDPNTLPVVLDPGSRALVTALHQGGPIKTTPTELGMMLARLEHHLVADSALNQFKLRPLIHRRLARNENRSLDAVNTFVYDEVFHTPRQDAWLGLLPRTDFTGLPGDGVVMP